MDAARPTSAVPFELSSPFLAALLSAVARRTGVDLAGQRPAMLARRAVHRIGASPARSPEAYLELLHADPDEPWYLLERLTIKVSRLFRNPATFDALRARGIPELRRARGGRELRAWSAGCAFGQEAWALAMLCGEAGGPFSVLGTDVDRAALSRARTATFGAEDARDVPPELAARHLEGHGGTIGIRPALARNVRFEAHDLGSAAPPAGGPFDLVACRNVLIYYLPERQTRMLETLALALAPGGLLVLGEAEWPGRELAGRLEIVDRVHRIFRLAGGAPAGSV